MFGGAGGGGGFLQSAAATAAGIAGGALLFQGISSMFGHGYANSMNGGMGMTPGLGETVVNNYYGTAERAAHYGGGSDASGPQDLDICWGEFLVTGSLEVVKRILGKEGEVVRLKVKHADGRAEDLAVTRGVVRRFGRAIVRPNAHQR
jgi:hypothetical protein